MIVSIDFRDFLVLEEASLPLGAFNLLLGPNGSGKTTALRAILVLGETARATVEGRNPTAYRDLAGATARFKLGGVLDDAIAELRFGDDGEPLVSVEPAAKRESVLEWLAGIRGFVLDPTVMMRPSDEAAGNLIGSNGAGLPHALAALRGENGERWKQLVSEFCRLMPEFSDVVAGRSTKGGFSFSVIAARGKSIPPENLSQGTLVLLGVLTLVFAHERPSLICLEEVERGIHPRLLREVRDLLYRISFPQESGLSDRPSQVISTTHSPYILDLFADTPEDVILATKEGATATFRRLDDVPDLGEMLRSGRLGDLWYSGILGGTP